MRIGYIVHNLNDPAVERRCAMLERGGATVTLAGFTRDNTLHDAVALREPLILGKSADAAMASRSLATLRTAFVDRELRQFLAQCDVIMSRNLEQLAIGRALVGERPLIYECLDIHRLLVGSGLAAKVIQQAEARLLPRVDLLLTSSPAFVREHFAKRPLRAATYLIENKLLVADEAFPESTSALPAYPLRIGWFGMLRCRKSLSFLTELVRRSDGQIEVLISGKPSSAELPTLPRDVAAVQGMHFTGAYSYADLPALYGQCHFAWTIDWFEEGLNSSWLLPNRLYEALSHGCIPVALSGIEVGRWLEARGAGLLIADPSAAMDVLLGLEPKDIGTLQEQVHKIDRAELIATTQDCRELVQAISNVGRS